MTHGSRRFLGLIYLIHEIDDCTYAYFTESYFLI